MKLNKMKWETIDYKEPTQEEIEADERHWRNIKHYCPHCKKMTTFIHCYVCGKRFCLEHAYEETESIDGHPYNTYPICYHCNEG